MKFGVGQSVRRVEDDRLVIGKGRYTDDITIEGQAHAYMVRSPHAHANIVAIDTSDAKNAPGVIAVITGEDLLSENLGSLPCPMTAYIKNRDGSDMYSTYRPFIAQGRVRHVGDTVAMIVAETLNQAKDAADLLVIDYEALPATADTAGALDAQAPVIWDEIGSNLAFDWASGDEKAVTQAFAKAAHVTKVNLINNRIVVNAMEPRAAIGVYDASRDHYTLYTGTQGVHLMRTMIANNSLKIAPEKLRVVTDEVGGGFGMKTFPYVEYPLVLFASKKLNRPVKWTGDRSDAFVTDTQGRDHVTEAELALDKDGKILGVRVNTIANLGGYLSLYAPFVPTLAPNGMHVGVYNVPALFTHVRGVYTNTVPVDAYRGAGRPEASYVIERLIDTAAHELGIAPAELRDRNFVRKEEMGKPVSGATLPFDSGDFHLNLSQAMEKSDWAGFAARRAESQRKGRLRGIGISYYVERTPGGSTDNARVVVSSSDGLVHVYPGTQTNGQGHETAWAQVTADKLGVDFEKIRVHAGDTETLTYGGGTGGSKSLYMAAGAINAASDMLIDRGKQLAANELSAPIADIEYRGEYGDASFAVSGTDRKISLFAVARIAETQANTGEFGAEGVHKQDKGSYPNGAHICEVEVDPETGVYEIVRFTAVDDFGRVVNPLLLAGQVHGGIVQGLGQAMGEHAVYDKETGQLITGSFMDYWMPRADNFPHFDLSYNEIPALGNALGVKGAGEAGTVGAPASLVNAMIDALSAYGVTSIDMPITPLKVWQAVQNGSQAAD